MANFKRRKCRRNAVHAKRGSTASWRKKHGFQPIRLVDAYAGVSYWDRAAWLAAQEASRKQWDHPKGRGYVSMMGGWPAWWDRQFHIRPKRAATKRLERKILRGEIDPDDTAWPLGSRKPHIYFW